MCLWPPRYYPERNCPTLSDCTDKTSWEILELRGKKKRRRRSPYACQLTLPRTMQFASHPLPLTLHPNFTGEVLLPCQLDIWTAEPSKLKWFVIKLIRIWAFTPARLRWEFNLIPEVWVDSWAMSYLPPSPSNWWDTCPIPADPISWPYDPIYNTPASQAFDPKMTGVASTLLSLPTDFTGTGV